VVRHLRAQGFTDVVGVRSAQVDLRDADATARSCPRRSRRWSSM